MNILKNQLYIKYIIRSVESVLPRRFIPMGRPHHRDSLTFILSGTCTFITDDGISHSVEPGDIMYLPMGKDYSLEVTSDRLNYIVADFLFDAQSPRRHLHITPKNPPTFERLFRKLANAFSVTSANRRARCMSLLYEIYSQLIQNDQDQYVPGSARSRIEFARTYIQSHITAHDLTVATLAKNAKMSEVHFRKLFTDLYGITPSKYITQERVAYAQTLMALNELRLEDIALQAGFSSLPHFCRVFKTTTGTTPAAYRQKVTKE